VKGLAKAGIAANAIHGNKSQSQRERVLAGFRAGEVRTLVATDIAARGIDVEGISHVVNFDLPNIPESYVHRIGRTARAGADGIAISFCDHEERAYLRDIEKLIRMQLPKSGSVEAGAGPQASAARPAGRHQPGRPQQDRPHGHGQRPHGHGQQPHGEGRGKARHGRRNSGAPQRQGETHGETRNQPRSQPQPTGKPRKWSRQRVRAQRNGR